mmetsp:Transcript_9319/g.28078  ORF Transcript_9319/g.28078 Transcript_9319/m.28078 type:complete len:183 (+) Transcript_9319:72-620(+)
MLRGSERNTGNMRRVHSCIGKITPTYLITSHLEENDPDLRKQTSSNTLCNRSEYSPAEYKQWLHGPVFVTIDGNVASTKRRSPKIPQSNVIAIEGPNTETEGEEIALGYMASPKSLTEMDMMTLRSVRRTESSSSLSSLGSEVRSCMRKSGSFNDMRLAKKRVEISPMVSVMSIPKVTSAES